jgi:hypothetical protein
MGLQLALKKAEWIEAYDLREIFSMAFRHHGVPASPEKCSATPWCRPIHQMKLSREKILKLSHIVTDVLVASQDVEFIEDRATIRQNVVDIINSVLKDEEAVDTQVRQKIASQKKEIIEGSEEWDVLYRRYYAEELRRMGIIHQASA